MGAKNGSGWPSRAWAMYQAKPAATDACVIAHNTSRRRRTDAWPMSIVLVSSEVLVTVLTPTKFAEPVNPQKKCEWGPAKLQARVACLSRRDYGSGVPGRQSFG